MHSGLIFLKPYKATVGEMAEKNCYMETCHAGPRIQMGEKCGHSRLLPGPDWTEGAWILAATTYVSEKDLPERWKEENHHIPSLKILSSSCLNLTCILLYFVPREARERKF